MFTSFHIRLSRLRLESVPVAMARTHHFGLRLSADEIARVAASAASAGQSPAAWLRALALGLPMVAVLPATSPRRLDRPATEHLSRPVSTRVTPEQYAQLEELAAACGLPVATYLRRAVLEIRPSPTRAQRRDVRPAIAALNQVGNNLNQLTKLANQGTAPLPAELEVTLSLVLAEVRRVRDALLEVSE